MRRGPNGDRAIPFAEFHRLPDDDARDRHYPCRRRDRHGDRAAGARFRSQLQLSEDQGSSLLRLCSGFRRCRPRPRPRRRAINQARIALGGVAHKPGAFPVRRLAPKDEVPDRKTFAKVGPLDTQIDQAYEPRKKRMESMAAAAPRGDTDKALSQSPVGEAHEYRTPMEHHNPMECLGSTALLGRRRTPDHL